MRHLFILLTVTSLAACGDLQHESPYDPESPVDLQARTAFAGTVALEPVGGVTPSLAGIQVSVAGAGYSATTDASGQYRIDGIPPGSYTLQAVLLNYETTSVSGITATLDTGGTTVGVPTLAMKRVRADLSGTVDLKLPDDTLELTGGASVSIDAGAAPPAALTILGRALASSTAGTALTDAQGAYVIPNVPAPLGSYTLSASKYGYVTQSSTVTFQDGAFVVQTVQLLVEPGAIVGSVLVVGGDDSAGVVVRARGSTVGGTPWEDAIPTDALGTFRLSGLPAGTYNVTYELADHATVSTAAAVAPSLDTALPPIELVRETGAVYGVATLAGMTDHSGIQVSVTPPGTIQDPNPLPVAAALTDADGNWRLDQLPAGITYTVRYERTPGFLSQTAYVDVVARSARDAGGVQLMAIPGRLSGSVSFEGGVPGALENTIVRLEGTTLSTQSLPSGAWEIGGVAGGGYTLLFERSGYDTQRVQLVIGPGDDLAVASVALVRSRGAIVGAALLDGAPNSAGVVVTASGAGLSFSTVTAEDGAFSLTGVPVLPSGSYTVTARKDPEWQPSVTTGVDVAPNGTVTLPSSPVTLQPVATASISGVALLEGAADHSATTVTLTGMDFRGVAVPAGTTASTDAAGAWTFGSLRAGSYQLAFSHTGFDPPAPVGLSVVTAQAAAVGSLTLAASRGGVGGAVTAAGAASHAGTVVEISGGPDAATTVTDAAGAWRVTGLRVGTTYAATYRRTGYTTPAADPFAISASATTTVPSAVLAVATSASVAGVATVERPAGANLGILVSLSGTDLNGAAVSRSTLTAADGSYTLTALPQGTYAISFTLDDYAPGSLAGIVTLAGATTQAPPVVLPVATGAVAGTVSLSAGAIGGGFAVEGDRSGTVVTLTESGVAVVPPAVTDAQGNYAFPSVPAAVSGISYEVSATRPYYSSSAVLVLPAGSTTTTAPGLTLTVTPSTLSGVAAPYDNLQHDGTVNDDGSGVRIEVTGTAFNGTAYAATVFTTNVPEPGSWTAPQLPAGTFDAVATSASRTCEAIPRSVVGPGEAVSATAVRCTDAVGPSAPTLGIPTGTGAQPGYTRTSTVPLPLSAHASDAVNFRGYQYAVGATPDWDAASSVDGTPASLTFSGLAANATNLLWVRAVDWAGNAGPAVSAAVIHDAVVPPATVLETPRAYVDATTTSVTLRGAEADANFLGYESCGWTQAATTACPASCSCASSGPCTCSGSGGSCTLDATKAVPAAFAVSLTPDQRTCLFARGVDRAGNTGAVAVSALTSDLSPPSTATFAPAYDPTVVTVHADYVDFFLTAAATDAPAGGTTPWKNVAFLEVDTGAGYTALCPAAACHPNDTFDPCSASCGCTDARLRCRGASFLGLRMPLLGGIANDFQVRAVDVAGNRGAGLSQQVVTAGSGALVQGTASQDMWPRTLGGLLAISSTDGNRLYELGPDQRLDALDPRCTLGLSTNYLPGIQPASAGLVVYAGSLNRIYAQRSGPTGFCSGAPAPVQVGVTGGGTLYGVTASGERAAWIEYVSAVSKYRLYVQEPGTDGLLGGAGSPAPTAMLDITGLPTVFQMQGSALVVGNTNGIWVFNAGAGAFDPADVFALTGAQTAGLSSDGLLLATYDTSYQLQVRRPGTAGGYGASDTVVTRILSDVTPWNSAVAVERNHVALFDGGSPNYLHHWFAGGDGLFASADDGYARLSPAATKRLAPTFGSGLAAGLLFYQLGQGGLAEVNPDVFSIDLSALRWETQSVSVAGLHRGVSNHAGALVFLPATGGTATLLADGRQSWTSTQYALTAADGPDLVALLYGTPGSIRHFLADADGLWFTAGGVGPTTLFTGDITGISAAELGVGGGKAIARTGGADATAAIRIFEPNPPGGTLAGGSTQVTVPYPAGSSFVLGGVGIGGPHAFFACKDTATGQSRLCYRHAGANGVFEAAGDDAATVYMKLQGGATYVSPSGPRVRDGFLLNGLQRFLPGADGLYGTADDEVLTISDYAGTWTYDWEAGGDFLAWILPVTGQGDQVFIANLRDGTSRQVTSHYSGKDHVSVDASGRLTWTDDVFGVYTIFGRTP